MRPTNLRFVGYQGQFDDGSLTPSIGGDVFVFTAGANSLLVGDVVYASGAFTVDKSNSAGNQSKVVGIVVGGDSIADKGVADFESSTSTGLVGMTAATTGQRVLVQVYGFTYAVADGVIANGSPVKASSTTSGYVTSATAGSDAGLVIGRNFGAATVNAGDKLTIFISAM